MALECLNLGDDDPWYGPFPLSEAERKVYEALRRPISLPRPDSGIPWWVWALVLYAITRKR